MFEKIKTPQLLFDLKATYDKMSWLNKKKDYKNLVEEKESKEQEQKEEVTYQLSAAASYYLTNSDNSEKKEESSLYQAQPNKEKLKKIL